MSSPGPSSSGRVAGAAVASGSSPSTSPEAAAAQTPMCPACGAVVPDPAVALLCGSCGALVAPRARLTVWLALAALGASLLGLVIGGLAIVWTVGAAPAVVYVVVGLVALAGALGVAAGLGLRYVVAQVAARESAVGRKFLVRAERIALAAAGALAVAGAGLGYFVFFRPLSVRPRVERAFADRLVPFLSLSVDPRAPIDRAQVGPPKLKGKVLVLNHSSDYPDAPAGRLAEAHFALPQELRAAAPDEVETVVWLDLETRKVGFLEYAGGVDALNAPIVTAVVIHLGEPPLVVARRENMIGNDPMPARRQRGQPAYRPPPVQVVLDYLLSLPQAP